MNFSRKTILLTVIILAIIFISTSCSGFNSSVELPSYTLNEVFTKDQAVEDLDFALKGIEDNFFNLSEELLVELKSQYDIEINNFDDEVTRLEIWQSISRIYAKLQTSHTGVTIQFTGRYVLPYTFDYYDNKLYLVSEENIDNEVVSIGGLDVETLYNNYKALLSYEVEEWVYANFEKRIVIREYLALMGVDITKNFEIIYINSEGKKVSKKCLFEEYISTNDISNHFSYDVNTEKNYAVFNLQYFPDGSETKMFKQAIDDFFVAVDENNIENVAFDLRNNTGGGNDIALYLLAYLGVKDVPIAETRIPFDDYLDLSTPSITNKFYDTVDKVYEGDFYVFTSNTSFSQSSRFAGIIQSLELGEVIGEVAGGTANAVCGDVMINTPNSQILCRVTHAYAYIDNKSPVESAIVPDYLVNQKDCLEEFKGLISR